MYVTLNCIYIYLTPQQASITAAQQIGIVSESKLHGQASEYNEYNDHIKYNEYITSIVSKWV